MRNAALVRQRDLLNPVRIDGGEPSYTGPLAGPNRLQGPLNTAGFGKSGKLVSDAQENDTMRRQPIMEDVAGKSCVICENHLLLLVSVLHQGRVFQPTIRGAFRQSFHLMPCFPQMHNDVAIYVDIGQKFHEAAGSLPLAGALRTWAAYPSAA